MTMDYYHQHQIHGGGHSGPSLDRDRIGTYNDSMKLHKATDEFNERQKKKKKEQKHRQGLMANLSGTRYEIVRHVVEDAGFQIIDEEEFTYCYLIWSDCFISMERIMDLKPFQRVNHFPGMAEICRKDCLAKSFSKVQKIRPNDFDFVPRTWVLPQEHNVFLNYVKEVKKRNKRKTFIVKPANGAMGNGIRLYTNGEAVPAAEGSVVQEYIDKPFLMDGYKCDLRIYVLVTSCDPLRIFLYNEGLLRLSTEKYVDPNESNMDSLFMHLTNYSVNKRNEKFERSTNERMGSKRSLGFLFEFLRDHNIDTAVLWRNIKDLIVKTIILAAPHLLHAYRMCQPGLPPGSDSVAFEILGFDILLDQRLRPWLLEVNRSPSFGIDQELDRRIKTGLLMDTLRLVNIKASDKRRNLDEQKARAQKRLMQGGRARLDHSIDQEFVKKFRDLEKRKEELRDMLIRLRRDASREYYENRNCGNFRRIFPPDDKPRQERYAEMLIDVFCHFHQGRGGVLQRDVEQTYKERLREEEILEILARYEADESALFAKSKWPLSHVTPRSSLSLTNLGVLSDTSTDSSTSSEESEEEEKAEAAVSSRYRDSRGASRTGSSSQRPPIIRTGSSVSRSGYGRPKSTIGTEKSKFDDQEIMSLPTGRSSSQSRSVVPRPTPNSRSGTIRATRSTNRLSHLPSIDVTDGNNNSSTPSGVLSGTGSLEPKAYEETMEKILENLKAIKIKYPGKPAEQTESILQELYDNLTDHQAEVSAYWLIKLNSAKRSKVIDIVRTNVRVVLQRIFKVAEVDGLRLSRLFTRVYNRLQWNHGQGLWACFQQPASWELIFSKSTEMLLPTELHCCRRVVQLCKDCLLVVFKFAADMHLKTAGVVPGGNGEYNSQQNVHGQGVDGSSTAMWTTQMTASANIGI